VRAVFPALALVSSAAAQAAPYDGAAQQVVIRGYDDHVMEPFVSRDGGVLLFNNRNSPPERTDLHWAERIDDLTFRYRARIEGANSAALDGVPTVANDGRFCFVSVRAYRETLATVHCGTFAAGRAAGIVLQADASAHVAGRLMFDVELSADGARLIMADGRFGPGGWSRTADLRQARWRDGSFRLAPQDDALFAAVNTPALEYAAALSADGRLLCFTRLEGGPLLARTSLWLARRVAPDTPFGPPERVAGARGFVEAGSFAPDGALYFHRRDKGRFTLWRLAP
jgi:hypothetical protein